MPTLKPNGRAAVANRVRFAERDRAIFEEMADLVAAGVRGRPAGEAAGLSTSPPPISAAAVSSIYYKAKKHVRAETHQTPQWIIEVQKLALETLKAPSYMPPREQVMAAIIRAQTDPPFPFRRSE